MGYELRATGANQPRPNMADLDPQADNNCDDDFRIARGMVGINEVLGNRYRYYDGFFRQLRIYRDCGGVAGAQSSGGSFVIRDPVCMLIVAASLLNAFTNTSPRSRGRFFRA